jgi:cytochrome c
MLGIKLYPAIVARGFVVSLLLVASAAPALSAGDPVAGQHSFAARCAMCHSTTAGDNKIGPSLAGAFGSPSGSVPGFNYSSALKSAHLTWDDATLDKRLQNPSAVVHGTTMFINVQNGGDRQNLIAYLETLSPKQ